MLITIFSFIYMNTAFIFPGQGSQIVGMGRDLYENFEVSKNVFKEVDDALSTNLSRIIFNGPMEDLTYTENAQPAIMATSMALVRAVEKELDKKVYDMCKFMAGHSLGEYTALCASDSISLSDTARILQIRGREMQEACKGLDSSMVACLDVDISKLSEILNFCKNDGVVEIANDNTETQIIISGETKATERVVTILKDMGKRTVKLNVSAPFHSSLILSASKIMAIELENLKINPPKVPIIQNITVKPASDPKTIKANLVKQVASTVRWRETIEFFNKNNVDKLVEVGAGKVLNNMLKRSPHNFSLLNISNIEEVKNFINIYS
jgi:[acyl-carrier-protein] S-malonyltransferase